MMAGLPLASTEPVLTAMDLQCKNFALSLGIQPRSNRPWTTVTYAQSLDGRIAANEGQPRLLLSGPESMQMTFRLRQQHDAILVTAATLNADDSQLTVRNIPECEDAGFRQPAPIVLDPLLVSDPSSRLFKPGRNARVLCLAELCDSEQAAFLRAQGVNLIGFPSEDGSQRISLDAILSSLAAHGIGSLLIEPGLRLIPNLLQRPHLLDALVVTVAPIIVGSSGRAPVYNEVARPALQAVNTVLIGQDVVLASHFVH